VKSHSFYHQRILTERKEYVQLTTYSSTLVIKKLRPV
jgi:hypothetical protein